MTPHDTFLELAAIAIDYPLAAADRGRLEAHLASCPACARSAHGFRADAIAFGDLPRVTLPERRGAEILAAAMHPAAIRHPLRLVLVAALLALLALGSFAAGAELLRRSQDEEKLVVVPPIATETPGPDASEPTRAAFPEPTPDPAPDVLVAYVGLENGRHVIRTVRPDGTGERTIAEGEAPAWSPDGAQLAYQCPPSSTPADPLPGADVCVANADGSGQRVVVTGAITPSWSPDGTRLLFGRSVIDAGDTSVVNLDGSGERWLGSGTGSWSPDGEWILLLGASGAEPDATIVHPDGSGARQLGTCGDAAWSPDGTQLACTAFQGTEGELRTVRVTDGVVKTMLIEHAQISEPTWLAEDRMLVMMTTGNGLPMLAGGDGLFYVDFAGERLLLIPWLSSPTVTSVAPGGAWWAVTVGSNGSSDVLLRSLSQGRTLTTDGTSMDAHWQPQPAAAEPSPSPTAVALLSDLAFQSIRVGSEDVAWASSDAQLLRTADGGATWTAVEPPVPNTVVSVAPDPDTAFLVQSDTGGKAWVTRDGGRSWADVLFPQEDGTSPPGLSFASPTHGFARFQQDRSASRVYETMDAGRTWTGPVVAGLPQGMLTKVRGSEGGVLWLSNGKTDNEPFDNRLLLSYDGGATWQEGRFPTGAKAPKNDLKMVDGLWADGSGRVVLAMSVGDGPLLYVSDDGAQTWRFVRSFVSGNTTVDYHVALRSGDEWILVAKDGSGSWSTVDGGANWSRVTGTPTASLHEVYVTSTGRFLAVQRCDLQRLQSRPGEPDPACVDPAVDTVLLVTADAGRTWTEPAN